MLQGGGLAVCDDKSSGVTHARVLAKIVYGDRCAHGRNVPRFVFPGTLSVVVTRSTRFNLKIFNQRQFYTLEEFQQ